MRRFFTILLRMLTAVFRRDPLPAEEPPDKATHTVQDLRRLRKWEENLRKREAVHAKQIREIQKHRQQQEACYQELKAFRQKMDSRQAELNLRQQQLENREKALTQQRDALEDAIARYCHERALWQQLPSHPVLPVLDGHVNQLRQDFRAVRNDLSTTQNALVRLMDQVQKIQNQGIEEICCLHRDAAALPTEESQRYAARLAVILRESFGAEPIEPVPGDRFDSTRFECGSGSGSTVTACIHRGWVWNGGIFRAIVALR